MSAPGKWFRTLGAACACLAITQMRVAGEGKAAEAPPDVVAKCTEFLKKVNALQRKDLDKRMADEIAEVSKATNLDADGRKNLEAAAVTAEDAAQADLLNKALQMYTKAYAKAGGRGADDLGNPDIIARTAQPDSGFDAGIRYTRALDQPTWKDALARVLTPEQAAAWQKSRDSKTATVPKEFEDLLDRQAEQIRTNLGSPIFARSTEIISTLNLPNERADAVNALAKRAVDASLDAWRQEARKTFLSKDEDARKRLARGRQYYSPTKDDDAPENQAVWTDGIAKLLSNEERAAIASSHGEQRKRRTHALAMVTLTLLDDKVAFTASQRPKLEPILERLVQKVDELYPHPDNDNDYFNLNPPVFYKAAAAAKAEEMRPILDDLQWKHWQEAGQEKDPNNEDEDAVRPAPTPSPGGKTPAAIEEPEDLEQMVSDYLANKSSARHRQLDATMTLQVEDAARVAGLPPATAARLRTAAHGAAEASLADWASSLEETVRAQTQGATRETVAQRINNANRYYFGQTPPKDMAVWKQAVKTELTAEQQDAWQAERTARAAYRCEAVAQFLLAEFDRNFILNTSQWDRLAPLLTKAMRDYQPDFERMFSYYGSQWFLTNYSMFLPMHAVQDEECKAIVGKDRFERWTGSNGYRYSVQYWSSVQQYHDQRMKEDKK